MRTRYFLIAGVIAYVVNFMLVKRADAFWGFWQQFDFFDWMR